jgi:transposase
MLDAAVAAGARARKVADLLGVGLTTLQRWRRQFAGVGDGLDRRKSSQRLVSHRLSEEERQRILLTCNQPEFAALPPGQIVPILADRGLYIGSERSFYRVLNDNSQVHRRGRAKPPQEPRPVPRLEARGANEVWSWDITYLPTSVRGVWLYLYLVIDVWSRKVVAWDVAEREDAQIAADLVSRACLRERIYKGRPQPLNSLLRQWQCHAGRHPRKPAGGAGGAEILLQAKGEQRQPLLGVAVPHCEIPAGLPQATLPERGRSLSVGVCIRGLVQPPAPPQRYPFRYSRSTP